MPPIRPWERFDNRLLVVMSIFAGALALVVLWFAFTGPLHQHPDLAKRLAKRSNESIIELDDAQAARLQLALVTEQEFVKEIRTVGGIDYNQNKTVDVYAHYPGRILEAYANVGDRVETDQFLFSMQSPDLLAAETALISAASVSVLQSKNLARAKALLKIGGISQMATDQTISDQQTAEGAIETAKNNVLIFGKTNEDIDKIINERHADPTLIVRSPVSGIVIARGAAPGLYVQPGAAPTPYTVADTSTMWLVANIVEEQVPFIKVGQKVEAKISALPNATFYGTLTVIGASLDPISRRMMARCEIRDPTHLLRAGMFADLTIQVEAQKKSLAAPETAIYHEGNGILSVWVTKDKRRFMRRHVTIGGSKDGFVQILSGVTANEKVVTDGALILSRRNR
jgi:membrane fusion protein, heavy metal efflux system